MISDAPTGSGYTAIAVGYTAAYALRPDGSIVAWGTDQGSGEITDTPTGTGYTAIASSTFDGYALALVPEPASIALLLAGGVGLLAERRRHRSWR